MPSRQSRAACWIHAPALGYTAIEAARTAEHVITIELDPTAQEMARYNPWSRSLFDNPKIIQIIGDAFEVVPSFEDGVFSCILHDPPMLSLAGELYSGEFYRDCWRVLQRGGKLFHYIGDPDSKSGARTTRGVVRRLQEAGFTRVIAKAASIWSGGLQMTDFSPTLCPSLHYCRSCRPSFQRCRPL